MWNRKKDEEYPAKPANVPHTHPHTQSAKEVSNPAVSSTPLRSYDPSITNAATIGKAVMVKGQILSREDLIIDGEIEGTVEAQEHRVTIGPNGKVHAGIKAREIVVLGMISGNVEASEKIDIRRDARLVGDIKTARIVIEDGAYFKGSIDIAKAEPKQKPAPVSAPPAAPVAQPVPQQAPLAVSATDTRK